MILMRKLWLLYTQYVLILAVHYADAFPIPTSDTINVTGYTAWGDNWKEDIIVVSNATWFDAVEECKNLHGSIASSGSNGVPFRYIRQQMFLHLPELIGQPLWTAFHKPNLDGIWYKGTKCGNPLDKTSYNTFDNDDATKRQCVLLNTTSNPSNIDFSWYAASCHERHSFICNNHLDTGYLKEYVGMAKLKKDELDEVKTFNSSSPEDCKQQCDNYGNYYCEFNSSSATCARSRRDIEYLPFEFNLTFVDNDTISYVKSQHNKVVTTTVAVPNNTYNYTNLPCYKDPVLTTTTTIISSQQSTDGDISAVTVDPGVSNTVNISPENVEQLVVDIREENTIDVKTLSSYRNKLISIQDNRPSAKTIGWVGAIFIGLLTGLIVVSDVPKFIKDIKSLHTAQPGHTVRTERQFVVKSSQVRRITLLKLRRNSI